ncbi:MAG: hypothetical protein R3C49_01620 [Planctomycetaceae bacterium]
MESDADGNLTALFFNGRDLGSGSRAFEGLNLAVRNALESLKGVDPTNADKQEVEIDPAYELDYKNIISAISACSGKMENGRLIRYISRIKFAPIRAQR